MYVLAVLRSALPAMPHSIGSLWQPATGLYKSFQSNYPLLFSCRVTFHFLQSPKCDTQQTAAGVSPQSVCSVMHDAPLRVRRELGWAFAAADALLWRRPYVALLTRTPVI